MNNQLLLDNLRCIPDWPIKGVNFRDVSTLFKNPVVQLSPTQLKMLSEGHTILVEDMKRRKNA